VVGSLAEGDAAAALERADELLAQGVTIDQALASLAEALHDLLLLSTCGGETRLVELSAEAKEKAAALAGAFDPAGLVHMVALCESVQRSLRTSANPRAIFDALLVRLALTEKIADVTALVQGASPGGPPAKKR